MTHTELFQGTPRQCVAGFDRCHKNQSSGRRATLASFLPKMESIARNIVGANYRSSFDFLGLDPTESLGTILNF